MKFKWIVYSLILFLGMSGCNSDEVITKKVDLKKVESIDKTEDTNTIENMEIQMKLTSEAFEHQQPIPAKYTCEGEGIAPELSWANAPKDTKSFVLIMDDPDAVGGVWDHWVVYNISLNTNSTKDDEFTQEGTKIGKSTNGKNSYVGPCPPVGSGSHNYTFKLYALDIEQIIPEGESKLDIENVMQNHILEETQLIGTYEKKKKFLFF